MKIKYQFSSKIGQYAGAGGWYFVSLPQLLAREIRKFFKSEEEGWGRLKVIAHIGNSEWQTAIWFDTRQDTYLLPLKAEVRKKENLAINNTVSVAIYI